MDESQAGKTLRIICVVASVLMFGYFCLLSAKSVAGFPATNMTHTHWPWLVDKPLGEDGFYMLTVAQNLASTHHLVYTYNMPATGIQPLATIVFAGIAFVVQRFGGDRWMLIRSILIFNSALFLLFTWLVAKLSAALAPPERKQVVFGIAFLLVLFDYSLFRLFTYGLETGVYLCGLALCMIVWQRIVARDSSRWSDIILLGVAAGYAGLCRIDFGLLFAILLGYLLVKKIASLIQVLCSGLIALLITSPWFIFVHAVSGSWLPSSGKAESRFITLEGFDRLHAAAFAIIAHIVPWSFAAANTWPTTIIGLLSLPLLVLLWSRAKETRAGFASGDHYRAIFLPWLIGIATLILVYVLFFWSTHFYGRYVAPLAILSIPLLALVLSEEDWIRRRPALIVAAIAVVFFGLDTLSLHTGHVGSSMAFNAGYIHANYPEVHVGSFQSGVIGFFNPNVENLDGKLNLGALHASEAHQMDTFLDHEQINVLVDWPGYLGSLPPDYINREWQPCPKPLLKEALSRCYIRKSYAASLNPLTR